MRGERASILMTCALAGGLLVAGCGSSSSSTPLNPGTGNSTGGTPGVNLGTGGSGGGLGGLGNGGAAGQAGSTKPECQLPSCFDVLSTPRPDCTPMGACVQQSTPPNVNICWANGVKEKVMISLDGTGNAVATATVKGTSGAACFSFDFAINAATGEIGAITFRDAAGKKIGTLAVNPDDSITATCDGQPPKIIPASCGMDMNNMMPGMMPGATMCTDGVCM
jgi:hypothetical protein